MIVVVLCKSKESSKAWECCTIIRDVPKDKTLEDIKKEYSQQFNQYDTEFVLCKTMNEVDEVIQEHGLRGN